MITLRKGDTIEMLIECLQAELAAMPADGTDGLPEAPLAPQSPPKRLKGKRG